MKAQREGRSEDAFSRFSRAADLVPRNVEYVTAREVTRQQLVLERIRLGDSALAGGNEVAAMAAFRGALEADPSNQSAAERLRAAAHLPAPLETAQRPVLRTEDPPQLLEIRPQLGTHNFHLRTDTRSLFVQVAQAFGIAAHVDDQVRTQSLRFDLDNADFALAIETAQLMAHAFWVPIAERDILVAPDTPQARQQYERVGLQNFYFSDVRAPQDLTEIMNMLRAVFDASKLSVNSHANMLTLRAPLRILQEAGQVIASMQEGRPQVLIDITVYQVSHTALHDLGVALPLQFQMFNLSNVQQALGNGNLQSLLSSLGANGAVNGQSVSAILAQLQGQNSQLAALLANPLATFGGGKTFFGVGIPPATLRLSLNTSNIRQLDHLSLNVAHGSDATFHFGERYPVLTASYSAVYSVPRQSSLTGRQNLAAYPAVSYQDLGLSVKATPHIHAQTDITLKIDAQIQALGASSVNGVPVLDNRQYQGTMNLRDGETAVVAGMVSEQDVKNIQGIPAVSRIPLLGAAFAEHNNSVSEDELLITITPHIVRETLHKTDMIVMTP